MAGSGADRVIDFSMGQAHLSVRYDQLIIEREDQQPVSTPVAEIAVLVLANRRVTGKCIGTKQDGQECPVLRSYFADFCNSK